MVDRDRLTAAIDATSADDLIRGLRLALIAYAIKVERTDDRRDERRMRNKAAIMARELLHISTAEIPL